MGEKAQAPRPASARGTEPAAYLTAVCGGPSRPVLPVAQRERRGCSRPGRGRAGDTSDQGRPRLRRGRSLLPSSTVPAVVENPTGWSLAGWGLLMVLIGTIGVASSVAGWPFTKARARWGNGISAAVIAVAGLVMACAGVLQVIQGTQ